MSSKGLNYLLHSKKYREAIGKFEKKFNKAVLTIILYPLLIQIFYYVSLVITNLLAIKKDEDYGLDKIYIAFKDVLLRLVIDIVLIIFIIKGKKRFQLIEIIVNILPILGIVT